MSDPDETLSADEGEPGDQYTGSSHEQPRQPVSQAALQDALPMGVSNFTFDFDSGIMLQDEDGLVGVSHHEQQLGLSRQKPMRRKKRNPTKAPPRRLRRQWSRRISSEGRGTRWRPPPSSLRSRCSR